MALSDFYPGIRQGTPYTSRWRSFLDDLRSQGVTVDPTQSGGYNPRTIRGTSIPSLHASDRAYDVNWSANPEGSVQDQADIARQHLERDMGGSTAPITQIHPMIARETAARHGLRWGGDFRTRSPDPMHFEVMGPAPGGMQGRSLIAHAGMTPPSAGASGMPTRRGLGALLFPAANAAEEPLLPFPLPPMPPQAPQGLQLPFLGPQQPIPEARPNMPPTLMQEAGPMQPPPGPPSMVPGLAPVPPAAPAAPMGVPQFPQGSVQPAAEPPTLEAPFPTPPDPNAIMAGATAAHAQNNPPQRGFFDKLEGGLSSPLAAAGLQLLFPQSNLSNAMQGAMRAQREQSEYQRQQGQRSVMDRIWAEAFPGGQPNMQHPLLAGQTPQVAAMIAGLGPEVALPLLAQTAMKGGQWELKDVGGQPVLFNPRGPNGPQVVPVPGMQGGGKPPAGFRWAANGRELEPIPGGPGEHIAGEQAGKLAVMRTAQAHFQTARSYFLGSQFGPGAAVGHMVGGSVLSPQYDQAARTVKLAVEGALRAVSGAAAPEAEVQRLTDFFTPRAFDPPAVRRQKMDMLEEFMRNNEEIVTRGRRPAGSNPAQQPQQPAANDPLGIR